jgi:hypothetical protein
LFPRAASSRKKERDERAEQPKPLAELVWGRC